MTRRRRRGGLSLLEMMAATTIMAALMTSRDRGDPVGLRRLECPGRRHRRSENAYGVLRHFVQQMRQADCRHGDFRASDTTGDLSFTHGDRHHAIVEPQQRHVASDFNNGTTSNILAKTINQMTFVGYEADGVTTTTVVDDIQVVKCTVQVTLTARRRRDANRLRQGLDSIVVNDE